MERYKHTKPMKHYRYTKPMMVDLWFLAKIGGANAPLLYWVREECSGYWAGGYQHRTATLTHFALGRYLAARHYKYYKYRFRR